MHDREFKLQLGIPPEFPRKSDGKYCHYADGLDDCLCVQINSRASIEDCRFYGRPVEPLAFYLPSFPNINQQKQSRLYIIPKEIRDLIFEYAFVDDGAPSFNCDNEFRRSTTGTIPRVKCGCTLLQTCKAVYVEAYRLPFLLNGYLAYRTNLYYGRNGGSRFNSPSRPDLERITPWQYALIQRVDLSLQQFSIESRLETETQLWQPALRHSGAYVSPRYYNSLHFFTGSEEPEIIAHNFRIVPATIEDSAKSPEDGNKVVIRRWDFEDETRMGNYTAAAMVARKITHFTLRMSRTDWWTWEDHPSTTDSDKQLALDPALGGRKPRPLLHDMVVLANMRRAGHHPPYDDLPVENTIISQFIQDNPNHHWYHRPNDGTWGAAIGLMPDLKTFELVLETFSPKKHQLEMVVECAKTWKFPIKDTDCELVCDNKIKEMQWHQSTGGNGTVSHDGGDASQETRDDPEASEDALLSGGNEPWYHDCTEFEVRVVRFRRRKVEER